MVNWKRWAVIIALAAIVLLAAAYFGGLLAINGPSGSVKAWSYETDISQTSFSDTTNELSQAFVPTTNVSLTTSVYALLHASTTRYGTYDLQWAIDCQGRDGGYGQYTWNTTTVVQEWVPMPADPLSKGTVGIGDSCILYLDVFPNTKLGGTGTLASSDIAWRQGGNVQPCPTCPAQHTYDAIVWGTPAGAPPASPTLKTSFTYNATGFTAVFQSHTSGGQGPYTYHWDFGDGKTLNETKNAFESETVVHSYPVANGTYKVTMYVSDSTGVSPTQTTSITFVKSTVKPGCTQNCGGSSTTVEVIPSWVWIVLVVAAVAIVLLFIFRRRL